MRIEKHNEDTSTIFFENDDEMREFKEKMKKQGFVKFDPNGKPIGLTMSDIGWNGNGSDSAEGANTRKSSTEIYFDVNNSETLN